ncbi:WD repeat-containing protein 78 isoform X3 [Sarcophilus harrisii]|uniref:Dynein axonemal intermediate chain 4 n=2 Tax=Sarcophilus harrisii TaxID=9305 RepID=G3VE68_SARHA|nr:WD repeat-containing protein 78 isoform X3 [Sarcophilus harrisii]
MPKPPNALQGSSSQTRRMSTTRKVSLSVSKMSVNRSKTSLNLSKTVLSRTTSVLTDGKEKMYLHRPRQQIQVWDSNGNDVTPKPLFHPDPHFPGSKKPSKLLVSQDVSLGSDFTGSYTMFQNTINPSFVGQFTRSALGSSTVSKSSASTSESIGEDLEEPSYRRETISSYMDLQLKKEVPKVLTKEELDAKVDIYLSETETLWLFNLPTVLHSIESEDAEKVKNRNALYETLCKNRAGNDLYVERIMQTFNGAPKHKEVQCDRILTEEKGIMTTAWALYDAYNALELSLSATKLETGKTGSLHEGSKKDQDSRYLSATDKTSETSSTIDIESLIMAKIHEEEEDRSELILKSDRFQENLFFMERVLMENIFQPKLAAYRQLPILGKEVEEEDSYQQVQKIKLIEEDEDVDIIEGENVEASEEPIPPNLERLWSFSCDLTKGHNVSSMAWNKANPDLLAVGYGHFGFREQKRGLACCWSLKNPMWPERVYPSLHGVTSVDFSISSPNLLAVGFYNGTIAIYNVQSNNSIPVLDSSESVHKHIGPIWQVQWVEQDKGTVAGEEKREILVTIGADGKISKWMIQKGLICHDLMKLRRTASDRQRRQNERDKKGEALISRQAPGMCFSFHPKDTNIYLAGTEEGFIHKCSCSYNEQYLETYRGHKAPVYRIAWNPFCHDVFLSCSADWGVILWKQDTFKPYLSFYSTTHVIYDVAWSPKSAYIFAAANEHRVEIWDLHCSTLDPIIVNLAIPGVKFTTVLFAKNTDCILIGDSEGQVIVYDLKDMPSYVDTGREDAINLLLGPEAYSV